MSVEHTSEFIKLHDEQDNAVYLNLASVVQVLFLKEDDHLVAQVTTTTPSATAPGLLRFSGVSAQVLHALLEARQLASPA
jgi:hypothetical protein